MEVEVCLDTQRFNNKPEKKDTKSVSQRIAGTRRAIHVQELADSVGNNGQTFCPAIFTGQRRMSAEFLQMQLFVLDFDTEVSYNEVKTLAEEYSLPVSFSYHTFCSTEEVPKFRVVFMHGCAIHDRETAEMMLEMFKRLFPQSDSSCFEVARMYFGGKGVIEVNDGKFFTLDILAYHFQRILYLNEPNQYSRNIRRFADRFHVGLQEKNILSICTYKYGDPPVLVENLASSYYIKIELDINSTKIVILKNKGKKEQSIHHIDRCSTERAIIRADDKQLLKSCRLFQEFINGTILEHNERFLLATNIIHIRGMQRMYLSIIKKYYDSYEKWKFDLKYISALKYKPMGCDGNCPYADICTHDINICLTVSGRKNIRRLQEEPWEFISLQEAEERLKNNFNEAYDSDENNIFLIKAQTGLGKTAVYINALNYGNRPSIIAVPTVALKHEVMERANKSNTVEALSLKDLCLPMEAEAAIQHLYTRGLYREAREYLSNYAKKSDDEAKKLWIQKYLKFGEIIKAHNKNIVMTHAEVLQLTEEDLDGYQIIIDEDLLMTIMKNTISISVEDVNRALEKGFFSVNQTAELKKLISMPDETYMKSYYQTNNYIDEKKMDSAGISGNINGIFHAGAYFLNGPDIRYFSPVRLKNVKYIIMSATLNDTVYCHFFPNRQIKLYDIPQARYKGELKQYTDQPMSRTNMDVLGEQCKGVANLFRLLESVTATRIDYYITFKAFDAALGNQYHFGNIEGIDFLKGKNGMIVGTAHKDECCYKLLACYLGVDVMSPDARICRQNIVYNGWEFNFMSYENSLLRSIQMYHIETEMEQAIGRSRLLRTDGKVFLFSNFPCGQAKIIQTHYLEDKKQSDASANASDVDEKI